MKQYSPKEIIQFLKKNWFIILRQKWSHVFLFNESTWKYTTLPFHNKDIKTWTLLSILKQCWLSKDDLKK